MKIGGELKQAREARGISLEEVEEGTKIRKKYLEALENDNYNILPEKVYVKGFLRSYAKFLGIDGEELVRLFKESFPEKADQGHLLSQNWKKKQKSRPDRKIKRRKRDRDRNVIEKQGLNSNKGIKRGYLIYLLAVVALLVILALGVYFSSETPPDNYFSSSQNKSIPQKNINDMKDIKEEKPQELTLVLQVNKSKSWVQVVVDGSLVFQGELMTGQIKNFHGKEKIWLKLGNAGAVQVHLNGKNLGYLGMDGEVVKREFIVNQQG